MGQESWHRLAGPFAQGLTRLLIHSFNTCTLLATSRDWKQLKFLSVRFITIQWNTTKLEQKSQEDLHVAIQISNIINSRCQPDKGVMLLRFRIPFRIHLDCCQNSFSYSCGLRFSFSCWLLAGDLSRHV